MNTKTLDNTANLGADQVTGMGWRGRTGPVLP